MKMKSFFSIALIMPVLLVLPACDWFASSQGKTKKVEKKVNSEESSQEVLITISGKPRVTVDDFQKSLSILKQAQPMLDQMIHVMPEDQQRLLYMQIADSLASQELVETYVQNQGWSETEEYKRNAQQMHEDLDRELASRELQQRLVKTISVTDSDAKKYYEKNKKTNQFLQRPPFMTKPAKDGKSAEYAQFDVVKDQVKEVVMGEKFQRSYMQKIEELKNKYSVDINKDYLESLIVKAPVKPADNVIKNENRKDDK